MPRYKSGSGIAKMWEAYESGGPAAATAAGKALGLAAATVKTRVEGWEREKRKGSNGVPDIPETGKEWFKNAKLKLPESPTVTVPEKPMTKERLLGILKDSKSRGASTFSCARWLAEARQLVKLGYAVESKVFNNAFTITKAGLNHKGSNKGNK